MNAAGFDAAKFLRAQKRQYADALCEISSGRKTSHWIWFVFPQLAALGRSDTAVYYGLADLAEAKAYLADDTLRGRLLEISEALLAQNGEILRIMGSPDHLKVRSCMTLFREAAPELPVFQQILDKFYQGIPDRLTLDLLAAQGRPGAN